MHLDARGELAYLCVDAVGDGVGVEGLRLLNVRVPQSGGVGRGQYLCWRQGLVGLYDAIGQS